MYLILNSDSVAVDKSATSPVLGSRGLEIDGGVTLAWADANTQVVQIDDSDMPADFFGGAYRYDQLIGTLMPNPDYAPPVPPPPAVPDKAPLTVYQFRSLFSSAEKEAIYTAAAVSVQIRIWLDDLAAAQEVRLDDPATVTGVQSLEAAGLIAPGRGAEILG